MFLGYVKCTLKNIYYVGFGAKIVHRLCLSLFRLWLLVKLSRGS